MIEPVVGLIFVKKVKLRLMESEEALLNDIIKLEDENTEIQNYRLF